MKKSFIIIAIILAISFTSHAQKNNEKTIFSVETSSLSELRDIDWNNVKAVFNDNHPNDSITISVHCNISGQELNDEKKAIKIKGDFKITKTCLASQIDDAITEIKQTALALLE